MIAPFIKNEKVLILKRNILRMKKLLIHAVSILELSVDTHWKRYWMHINNQFVVLGAVTMHSLVGDDIKLWGRIYFLHTVPKRITFYIS
jgi:hypothetical protein